MSRVGRTSASRVQVVAAVLSLEDVLARDLPGVARDDPGHQCWAVVFWQRVNVRGPDECWEWAGRRGDHGHGRFDCAAFGVKNMNTSQAVELLVGGLPGSGPEILHDCDNPPCVNQRHLRRGTHAQNMADMVERGRSRNGRTSRITVAQLVAITDSSPKDDRVWAERLGYSWEYIRSLRLGHHKIVFYADSSPSVARVEV